jgi:hypothetical protein
MNIFPFNVVVEFSNADDYISSRITHIFYFYCCQVTATVTPIKAGFF